MANGLEIFTKPAVPASGIVQSPRPAAAEPDHEIELVLNTHRTRVVVVGCGGSGNNTVTRLMDASIKGVQTLAINTDAQDLLATHADGKILIGRNITRGLGAGSNPEVGEEATRESQQEIETALQNSDLVFLTCGLGGGTGTGAVPIVAEIAKKIGALTIAAVTLPFRDEGVMRWENACRGLDKLRQHADTVMVIQNDRLLDICPDMPLEQAFQFADETVINAIKSITELISQKGLVNLDFADVRAVMQDGGAAIIGIGEGEGEDRAQIAVEKALRNQLLNIEVSGAKRALIHLTGGPDMSLKDTRTAMKIVSAHLDASAQVIWGSRIDPNLDHAIRVMLIITGLQEHYLSADFRQRDLEDNKQVAAPGVDRKKDAGPGTENLRDEVTDHQSRQAIKQNGIPSKRVEAERENNVPGRTRRRTQPKIQHPPKIDGATVLPPAEASPERSGNAVSSRAEIDRDRGSTPRLLHPLTSLPQPTEPIARAQSRDPHDSSMLAQLESQMLKQKNESRDRQLAAPSSKITFSKALAEEIHAYLQSLHEAAAELLVAPTGQPALRRMKNAILAINYTAQRFAFFPLVDYATTVIEIFDRATNGEIKITEQFVNAVKPIGAILEGIIQDDADAFMEAKQHREKLLRLMDAFTNQPSLNVTNNGGKTPKGDSRADDSFFLADSKPANTSTKNKPPTGQSVKPVFEVMDYLEK